MCRWDKNYISVKYWVCVGVGLAMKSSSWKSCNAFLLPGHYNSILLKTGVVYDWNSSSSGSFSYYL